MSSDSTSSRKSDHIDLALKSQVSEADNRFYYEPVMNPHPLRSDYPVRFLGYDLGAPVWVSSMTGGTRMAGTINRNLAMACGKFRLGMGLGSCRILMDDDTYLDDFRVRKYMGDDIPLYANLGIAQVAEILQTGRLDKIRDLIDKTEADGLIIHINPLQEWLQPEGDVITESPVRVIEKLLHAADIKLIVKEVGQGMGPESLKALMTMPLTAIDFGAHGGTNFALLEMLRGNAMQREVYQPVARIGHTADEMAGMVNEILKGQDNILCKSFIISGGIRNFLDGYYLINKIQADAIYGQASAFLQYAQESYESLCAYMELQVKGLAMAGNYLKCKY